MILALVLLAGQLALAQETKPPAKEAWGAWGVNGTPTSTALEADIPPGPPKIDYKLQFEARTLESQLRELQQQFAAVQAAYAAKMEAMKQACGSYQQSVDAKTTEYVCVAKPEPTRNESGTWKGVTPPAR